MRLPTCFWFLWFLTLLSVGHGAIDICSKKLKELKLEPMCIYRTLDHVEGKPDIEKGRKEAPEFTNPRVWELSRANGRFAMSLYKHLSETSQDTSNIFMSPLSISTAFAMTKLGACNTTLEQLMQVFHFDTIKEKTSDQVHFFFAKLNCRLYRKKDKETELISANRLFGEKTLFINETYQNISELVYGAKVMPLNFKDKPEVSRKTINDWISNKTENKIQDILSEGALDSNTVLVLVNAIYFKGQWKNKFEKELVYKELFFRSKSLNCSVSMMYKDSKFQYGRFTQDKVQVLELPYKGEDIRMVLILPAKGTPLSEIENQLDFNKLTGWLDAMKETTVTVQIPRFRISDEFSLKEKLKAMGLQDLFDPVQADLPGIFQDEAVNPYISEAYHKAFLEVNEEGSEAAAATAVVAVGRSINPFREVFQANRPFLLLIREATINTVIFVGRVANPCS